MGIFPDTLIAKVLDKLEAGVVLERINYRSEMIQSTASGIKCFCPIHRETVFRTLLVDPKARTFQCSNYNCAGNKGGDLIELYAQARDLSYEQALLELSHEFEIEIDLSLSDSYIKESLEVARNYLELGVYADAEEHFDRILLFKSDCIPALESLARLYEATGRPGSVQTISLRLARVYFDQGQYQDAIEILRKYTAQNADDYETRQLLIDCLRLAGYTDRAAGECMKLADDLAAQGEVDRALFIYRRIDELGADGVDASRHIVQLLINAGRRDEAIAENLHQADFCQTQGDPEAAVGALEQALDIDHTREDLVVRLAEVIAEFALAGEPLAHVCGRLTGLLSVRAHGPVGVALDVLDKAFPLRPQLMALRADLEEARGCVEEALDLRLKCVDVFHQARDYELALDVLEHTLAKRRENVALLSRKAGILRDLKRMGEAIPIYLEIVELFKNAEEYEHAAAVYQTVIDLEADNPDHRMRQFELYLHIGIEPLIIQKALDLVALYRGGQETEHAVTVIKRALECVPRGVELLECQGGIFEEQGRRGEAAEQYLSVGHLYLERGEHERARAALERALKCVPEHLKAREAMADALNAQGMALQSMSIYSDLIEFFLRETETEAVIRIAQKILNMQAEHVPTMMMLAKAYGISGEVDKQLSTQTRLVQLYLKSQSYTRAAELCEDILSENEDYLPAIEQLVAIAESTRQVGKSVIHLWKLSCIHARNGRRESENDVLNQILERDPLFTKAAYRSLELMMEWATPRALDEAVGRCVHNYTEAGRGDEATRLLEDLSQTPQAKPEIYAGLAILFREAGDNEGHCRALRTQAEMLGRLLRDDEALIAWNELAKSQKDDLSILRTRIEIMMRNDMRDVVLVEYRRLAEALIDRGRFEEAEVSLLEVLNIDPDDTAARDCLITILIRTNELSRAADQVEEAAGRLLELGRYAESIEIFKRIFEFDPDSKAIYRKIIAIYQRIGDMDGAMEMFSALLDCLETSSENTEFEQAAQEAIYLQPEAIMIRQRLAAFYVAQGRAAEAESLLLVMAVQNAKVNRITEAESFLDQILTFNPDSLPARAQRAQLMARRGQTDEALSEFLSLTGSFINNPSAAGTPAAAAAASAAAIPFGQGNYEGLKLVSEYTFDTFVVGSRNNFAHATAMAVSRMPARSYNPLFLYSDVGLGKTHLCHAIIHHILEHHPGQKLLYTTTEDFVAELIDAIQGNEISPFRNRHKLTDVLIIDDVQFLSGKERAQEEFFHIFNAIYQAGKQVVLTSDRPPKDISQLEKRLKSRFGAGIIVDIQPPDLETRMAILKHELASRGKAKALSDEILFFVAENVESNVRELKGALNQLIARQEFGGEALDLPMTRQIIAQNITSI